VPVRLVTAPAVEPVTLTEAKAQLRLDTTLDDTFVEVLIAAAREYAEQYCGRGFITQTWELTLDAFRGEDFLELGSRGRKEAGIFGAALGSERTHQAQYVKLPMGRLIDVTSVTYLDTSQAEQTLASNQYDVDTDNEPGRLRPAYGVTWPNTLTIWDAVRIRYRVGYGASASDVPKAIKMAVLMLVSQMYEHRTPEVTGTVVAGVGFTWSALLAPYRLTEVG
jgi:hypothetical protein